MSLDRPLDGWTGAARRFAAAAAVLALACGGDGGGGEDFVPAPPGLDLDCAGALAASPDQISLDCPGSAAEMISIEVVIGGPSTSGDIFEVLFDIVFDDAVLAFEPPAVEGTFLNQDGGATLLEAGLSGSDDGRLIVAVARQGMVGGVAATQARELVVTLVFRAVAAGTSSLSFENASALDSTGTDIPSISFDGPLTLTVD